MVLEDRPNSRHPCTPQTFVDTRVTVRCHRCGVEVRPIANRAGDGWSTRGIGRRVSHDRLRALQRRCAPLERWAQLDGARSLRRSTSTLAATTIVDRLINTAPTASVSTNPPTPSSAGDHPVAQHPGTGAGGRDGKAQLSTG